MKIRRSIIVAAAAVVLGGTGILVLPTVASAHSAATTLKFTAAASKSISFDGDFAYKETDRNSTGAVVGFDVVYFTEISCCAVSANVTFALKGGLLYGTFVASGESTVLSITDGKVTGGTGAFDGVTGTITAPPTDTLTKIRFTITYS